MEDNKKLLDSLYRGMRASFDVDEQIAECERKLKERKSYRDVEESGVWDVHDPNFVVDHPDIFLANHISELKAGSVASRFLLDYIDTNLLSDVKTVEDLSPVEEDLLMMLCNVVMPTIFCGDVVPPLTCLELYLCCHNAGKPQLSFVSEWIYKAFQEYYVQNESNTKQTDLVKLLGLKNKSKTTPFTARRTADLHDILSNIIHSYRIIGKLSVDNAIEKTKKLYAMESLTLRKVYYKHKIFFTKWEEDIIELGYKEADLSDSGALVSQWRLHLAWASNTDTSTSYPNPTE